MKKRMKKLTALLTSAMLAMGLLAGCGSSDNGASSGASAGAESAAQGEESTGTVDTSEHVDLKMYLIGERTPDFDEVYGKINEILEEKLNCSISVDFLSWGEHDTKYSLLFSSGEDFDLIFTASARE